MRKFVVMPVLAAVLFAAACGDGGPTEVTPPPAAYVGFFNATTDMAGRGGFTVNGQFENGSALAFGQSTQACSSIDAGTSSIGFGPANTAGTALSGNVLAALNNQTLVAGANYTVVAVGPATSPQLLLLDNTFSGTGGGAKAAVRFVNLAPQTDTTVNFAVFRGTIGNGHVLAGNRIAVGEPTTFAVVTSGSNTFSVLKIPGHTELISGGSAGTFNLAVSSVNTLAIVPNPSGGIQLINIRRCIQ